MKVLQRAWNENDLQAFAVALGFALAVLLALAAARYIASRALAAFSRRRASRAAQSASSAARATRLWLLLPLALQVGASALELPARLEHALAIAAVAGVVLQLGLWTAHLVSEWVEVKTIERASEDAGAVTALALLGLAARVGIWALVVLFILNHMGFNITALVAGLGIGGVAVALALQNVLGDLFSSLSIVLDKPFVVGDFIVVDTLRGTVERIGVKTTRVRSLGGETLVFSNSDLLKSRVRNFKHLSERRATFTVGVTYETPVASVRGIAASLREIVEASARTRFDRAHFKEFGDSALVFEVVYYVLDAAYNTYMDVQQEINMAILERFTREGISIAYPTRTLHLVSVGAPGEPSAQPA